MQIGDQVLAAIVSGVVSLLVSVTVYWAADRKLRQERVSSARQIAQKFAEELLRHRLRLYPKAFEVTSSLGKGDSDDPALVTTYKNCLDDLRQWKTGEVELVISEFAEDRYYELIEKLKKNPGRGSLYNRDQVLRIFNARQRFRGALRRDLGLLKTASRMRIDLPEDES